MYCFPIQPQSGTLDSPYSVPPSKPPQTLWRDQCFSYNIGSPTFSPTFSFRQIASPPPPPPPSPSLSSHLGQTLKLVPPPLLLVSVSISPQNNVRQPSSANHTPYALQDTAATSMTTPSFYRQCSIKIPCKIICTRLSGRNSHCSGSPEC